MLQTPVRFKTYQARLTRFHAGYGRYSFPPSKDFFPSARLIEKSPVVRVLGTLVIVLTYIEFYQAGNDRKNETIHRAWNLLAARASGNSGKIEALETLVRHGIPLANIDLSCETMGGIGKPRPNNNTNSAKASDEGDGKNSDKGDGKNSDADNAEDPTPSDNANSNEDSNANLVPPNCERQTYLRKIELPNAMLQNANFSGADLTDSIFTGAILTNADFSDSTLFGSDFSHSNLHDAELPGLNLAKVDFSYSLISNANFEGTSAMPSDPESKPFIWSGNDAYSEKPIGLDRSNYDICVWQDEYRDIPIHQKPDPCIAPEGVPNTP